MGGLLSRRINETDTFEVLTELTKKIDQLEARKKSNVENQKRAITSFVIYSVLVYGVMALVWYFFFLPKEWMLKIVYSIPLLVFPLIIYFIKRILHWFFVKRISGNELRLEELKEHKKKILDEVMEKETYKKAKEILAKFGRESDDSDESKEVLESSDAKAETSLRRRNVSNATSMASSPTASMSSASTNTTGQQTVFRPVPIRPILKPDRTMMDKLVDYILGDGPHNRFALICSECKSHNGMALQEEFEFIGFKCVYCSAFNPSRKQKPFAPKLETDRAKLRPARKIEAQPIKSKSESKINGESVTNSPETKEDFDESCSD